MAVSDQGDQPTNGSTAPETHRERKTAKGVKSMAFEKESIYHRCLNELVKIARKRQCDFFAPGFSRSELRDRIAILRDDRASKVAVFKIKHSGRLELLEAFHRENGGDE
jgi:hypothetical protein